RLRLKDPRLCCHRASGYLRWVVQNQQGGLLENRLVLGIGKQKGQIPVLLKQCGSCSPAMRGDQPLLGRNRSGPPWHTWPGALVAYSFPSKLLSQPFRQGCPWCLGSTRRQIPIPDALFLLASACGVFQLSRRRVRYAEPCNKECCQLAQPLQ